MATVEPSKEDRTQFIREYDRRRAKRADRLFHWSLDMPPGEEDVEVNVNKSGLTWKELLVIAGATIGGVYLYTRSDNQPPAPVPSVVSDSEYEVRFYDREGNPIRVPPLSERPTP